MTTLTNKQTESVLGISRHLVDKFIDEGKLTPLGTRPRKFHYKEVYQLERETKNDKKQRKRK